LLLNIEILRMQFKQVGHSYGGSGAV
jgi:hypothetical protein